jgi:DNA mismatch repair protein MutL
MPICVNLTPTEKASAVDKADFLLEMGFETEDFGGNSITLRSLPADCLYEEGEDLFIELLGILMGNESGEITAIRDKAIYTVACHSAIRANQDLTLPELEKLYKEAAELEGITTCPHGRPITVKLTKYQIEKMFGRIV